MKKCGSIPMTSIGASTLIGLPDRIQGTPKIHTKVKLRVKVIPSRIPSSEWKVDEENNKEDKKEEAKMNHQTLIFFLKEVFEVHILIVIDLLPSSLEVVMPNLFRHLI